MTEEVMQMPYQRWYWRDWFADQAILMLPPEHRCIWFEMLGLMASGDAPGFLDTYGVEPDVYISFQRRIDLHVVQQALIQIERLGLFSRDESGRIFSRRIIREADEFSKNQSNGSRGGRPKNTENPNQKPQPETPISISISRSISIEDNKCSNEHSSDPIESDLIPSSRSQCPYVAILEMYHQTCPMLPAVKVWTPQRAKVLRARWDSNPEFQSMEFWEAFFTVVAQSDFLTGQVQTHDRSPFVASFDWLMKPSNFSKVIEGNYSRNKAQGLRF